MWIPHLFCLPNLISLPKDIGSKLKAEVTKPRAVGMVVDMADASWGLSLATVRPEEQSLRFPYARPEWLYLVSEDELSVSGDQVPKLTHWVLRRKKKIGSPPDRSYFSSFQRNAKCKTALRLLALLPNSQY